MTTKETTEGAQPKTCKDCLPVPTFSDGRGELIEVQRVVLCPRHASVDVLVETLREIADTAERASYVQDRPVGIIKQTCAMIAADARKALSLAGDR